eukprot:4990350-Alexandrium_andersonii.AAC.1
MPENRFKTASAPIETAEDGLRSIPTLWSRRCPGVEPRHALKGWSGRAPERPTVDEIGSAAIAQLSSCAPERSPWTKS